MAAIHTKAVHPIDDSIQKAANSMYDLTFIRQKYSLNETMKYLKIAFQLQIIYSTMNKITSINQYKKFWTFQVE